jgi:GTPase SAR1 family protein
LRITLSLWDIGGQERFTFFKTDFFKGTAAIGLAFDLSRPDTFQNIDMYFDDIRKRSGNIPIILVGNKSDLIKTIGQTIPRDIIIQKVNRNNLIDYIETSALKNINVDKLFETLALSALLDLRPRLGEIVDSDHFRFKVLLAGDASVGKSSLIKEFVENNFDGNYKITVGLDLLVKDIDIPDEELPEQAFEIIKDAISAEKRRIKEIRKLEKISKAIAVENGNPDIITEKALDDNHIIEIYKKMKKKKVLYLILIIVCIFSIISLLAIIIF